MVAQGWPNIPLGRNLWNIWSSELPMSSLLPRSKLRIFVRSRHIATTVSTISTLLMPPQSQYQDLPSRKQFQPLLYFRQFQSNPPAFTRFDANGVGEEKNSAVTSREKFLQVYSVLKAEILADSESFKHTLESRAWTEKNMDHNVPGGKLNRGLSVVDSARLLKEGGSLTEDEVFKACALGWCIEWLQGYFLVMDDIMDHSITRRGQPCWYKMPKVGLIAINDGILLSSHIFLILKHHFKSEPYYADLLDLFNEVSYQTASGQMLDLITTPEGEVDISKYTISTYNKIVQYKTAYYSFYLPVACAMMLVGEKDESQFEAAKGILVQMGTYFQVQDDFLDCFGDPAVIGKVGTDIEDTKCSWLVVQALQRASSEQQELLKRIYGKADTAYVAQVKQLYNDLKLKEVFEEYEAQSYMELRQAIARQTSPAYHAVFLAFLGKIYKRQK